MVIVAFFEKHDRNLADQNNYKEKSMNIQQIAQGFQRTADNFRAMESRLKTQDEKILKLERSLELALKRVDDLEGAAIGAAPAIATGDLTDGEEYLDEGGGDGL
jgi:predicted RNase H-like nuclease (RuvC/YqgF family)